MAPKNEAKIKFTAETEEFNKAIKKSNSSMQEFRSELKLNAAQMKTSGETVELLRDRHEILQKELDASKSKTDALSDKIETAKRIFGKNSEEVQKLQIQLNNAQAAEEAIKREIGEVNKKLDDQKLSLNDVSEAAGKVGDKLTSVGKGMSVVSAGIVAAGTASVAAFNEVDEGADNVIKATGATGEAAAELSEVYENVASQIVGDFGDIGSAVGEINTRFGYNGEQLEESALAFQKFSAITGVDATEAVKSVARALNDAGIPLDEYDTLLDQLAKAGQAAGIDVTKLAEELSKNGSIMRSMGFDTEETIALLANFELAGADASTMLTGMKKAMATWADAGKDGTVEFGNMVKGIQDGSITASDAIDAFGTKAGPMLVDAIKSGKFEYQDMLAVIQDSKGTVSSTFDETVDGGYKLELAMQNAKIAAAEVGETLSGSLVPIIEGGIQKLKSFAGWWETLDGNTQKNILTIAGVVAAIGPALIVLGTVANAISKITHAIDIMRNSTMLATIATKAQAAAQTILNAVMSANPIILVILAIVALVAIFVTLWNKCEWFREFWIGLWEGIKTAATAAWEAIKTAFSAVSDWFSNKVINPIKNLFTSLWDGIKAVWDGICNVIQVAVMLIGQIISAAVQIITLPFRFIWENCKEYVFAAWEWIKSKVTAGINAVKSVITAGFNVVKNVFTTVWNTNRTIVLTVWNAIKSAVTTAANAVKNVVTTIWNNIKSVTTSVWNRVKSAVSGPVNAVKSHVSSVFNAVKSTVTSIWNGIKSVTTSVWNGIKGNLSIVINGIKTAVSNGFNAVKSTASNIWDAVKNTISDKINAAKDKVKSGLDAIKGFFNNLKLKLPHIKLPHFTISGSFSLNPPSVPHFSVEWYKHGGVMMNPTIFGINGNKLMAGGEAGPEAIAPISTLQAYISEAVEKASQIYDLRALAAAVEDLASRPIELSINGRNFATATASDGDSVNGLRSTFKSRGLVLD